MGLSSSALKLERFTCSSNNESLVEQSTNFALYHALIKMGFESDSVLRACDKFKTENQLEKAINFILSSSQNQTDHLAERPMIPTSENDDELEIDEDGYIKMQCEISTNEGQEREVTQRTSSSCSNINDEVIRFHLDLHKESIEEQRIINKMADEYEQRRIYEEMLKKEEEQHIRSCLSDIERNLQFLQSAFHAQSQYLQGQYQIKISTADNGDLSMIQLEFDRQMDLLKSGYLQQKAVLEKKKRELQKMFDSFCADAQRIDSNV